MYVCCFGCVCTVDTSYCYGLVAIITGCTIRSTDHGVRVLLCLDLLKCCIRLPCCVGRCPDCVLGVRDGLDGEWSIALPSGPVTSEWEDVDWEYFGMGHGM